VLEVRVVPSPQGTVQTAALRQPCLLVRLAAAVVVELRLPDPDLLAVRAVVLVRMPVEQMNPEVRVQPGRETLAVRSLPQQRLLVRRAVVVLALPGLTRTATWLEALAAAACRQRLQERPPSTRAAAAARTVLVPLRAREVPEVVAREVSALRMQAKQEQTGLAAVVAGLVAGIVAVTAVPA